MDSRFTICHLLQTISGTPSHPLYISIFVNPEERSVQHIRLDIFRNHDGP